jgi:hypothetical protein
MKNAIIALVMIGAGVLAAEPCAAIERHAVIIGSRVQIHESASGDSAVVGLLNEEASVAILGRQPGPADVGSFTEYWYLVGYRGKTGWVFGQFLMPSTDGRGLARIFTVGEMTDYCDHAAANLTRITDARLYGALVDDSGRFMADIKEMAEDPILSPRAGALEPYRLFAVWSLAVGYAGTGDIGGARKIREQLTAYDPGILLPDRKTLRVKLDELDAMIRSEGKTTE